MVLEENGVSLFYEVIGEGTPLVLLHGNGEDHTYFTHQIQAFTNAGFQLIMIDMRGHGASSLGEQPLSFSLFATDVKRILDHLQLSKVHMLGFSDGANTAMAFALQYPSYLDHLILNAGNCHPLGMKFSLFCEIFNAYRKEKNPHKKQILALMVKHPHIRFRQLHCIPCATMVLTGEFDLIRRAHSHRIAQALPHAIEVILANAGHGAAQEVQEAYNECVLSFLQGESQWKKY